MARMGSREVQSHAAGCADKCEVGCVHPGLRVLCWYLTCSELGELELTMMHHSSRAANVRPLLKSGQLPSELSELEPEFDKAFRSDFRGTRMSDLLGIGDAAKMQVKEIEGKATFRNPMIKELLVAHVNGDLEALNRED